MSERVRRFLQKKVAVSGTVPYNHQGNDQCERYNGLIWKTVQLADADKGVALRKQLFPEAMYAITTLLCTAPTITSHERFLPFPRRISTGASLLSWHLKPGVILLEKIHATE